MASRNLIRKAGVRPLFVLAGFPGSVHDRLRRSLERSIDKPANYISIASPTSDEQWQYGKNILEGLIRGVGGFAIKRRKRASADRQPETPSRIFLLYVAGLGWGRLLTFFDFFAYPIWLQPHSHNLSEYDVSTEGREPPAADLDVSWRHNPTNACSVVAGAIRLLNKGTELTQLVSREITERRGKSPLLLPPGNFHHPVENHAIAESFRKVRGGQADWAELLEQLKPRTFKYDDLPQVLGPLGKPKGRFFQDPRGLIFPPDPNAHGLARELPADCTVEQLRLALNQLFRFGMPISDGFHHDAQRQGQVLVNELLDCSVRGRIAVSATHANIYANDHVRWSPK